MFYRPPFFNRHQFARGFTLVELLVVISLIGLLATGVMLSLQHQRAKARDARRLADLSQLKTALALYHASQSNFPVAADSALYLGLSPDNSTAYKCLSDSDIGLEETCTTDKIFMERVPGDPLTNQDHSYQYQSDVDGSTYGVDFLLEIGNDTLSDTGSCLTPDGFKDGGC